MGPTWVPHACHVGETTRKGGQDEMLCWMCTKPIGKDDTKVSPVWVLYRDWLYRKKILKKFLESEVG